MVRAEVKGIVEIVENEKIKIPDLFGEEGLHGKGIRLCSWVGTLRISVGVLRITKERRSTEGSFLSAVLMKR